MKKILILFVSLCFCVTLFAQKKIKVACVGNSITYGYTLPDRETNAYPAKLQKMLGDDYVVGNFGKSGATLLNKGHRPYMQQEEYHKAIDFAGDIVVIHLGINDTDPRDWPNYRDFFIQDYRALIDSFRVANSRCRILIARLTPIADRHPRFESGTRDWHDEIQLAIENIAKYAGVQLIDFHAPLYPYPFMLPDAVHPNVEGAEILAKTVYEGITGDFGGLRMSPLYTDNMVLQHGKPLTIQGTANAGDRITVSIAHQKQKVVTGMDGKWSVTLSPLKAGGPYTLVVSSGKQKLTYGNVLAGEVWLCSGQSNMEFYLNWSATAKRDVAKAANDNIRLFDMKARWRTDAVEWNASVLDSLNHLQYYKDTEWTVCSPQTAGNFSAVAYYQQKIEYRKEALLYFKEEDYSKTISYLEEALKRKSVFAREIDLDMTCYLAESHYQLKEYDKAEKIYNKLINNDSKNAQYYMLKGECVAKSGDAQGAVKVYEQGWNHTQDTDFLEKICEIYVEKQNYDKALKYVQKGIEQGGETKADFMYGKIVIYEKAEAYDKAYEAAKKYVELYPDDEAGKKEYTFLSTRI